MGKGIAIKRILSIAMALTLILSCLPSGALSVRAEAEQSLAGKTLSILGASISTFGGTSNGAAADITNSTIRSNAQYYPHTVVKDVALEDTWWMQAVEDLGLQLLVNNSWSGSSLLHTRNGTVGAYVDRCVQLHDDTGDNAGEKPDIIAIQMGTNDFQYYKDTLGTADIDYETLIKAGGDGSYTYAEPTTSLEAAAIVLHKISVRYPDAEVYYLNISQRIDGTDELIRSFNAELEKVVEHFGAHIVDIYGSAITMENFATYIGDGRVHPNKLGMDAYTEAFKRALIENTNYTVDTHTVTMNLDGIAADYGDDKLVVHEDSFAVNLTAEDQLEVTVQMGGQDITAEAYANGKVTIGSVTDDVTITARSVHKTAAYRWEFDGIDLVCVSGGNPLTKNGGTTADGVFSNTRYALDSQVVLLHDLPWAVEWKCAGTFMNTGGSTGARVFTSDDVNANYNARYIFKSNKNGLIAMGEKTATGSHNYGIALGDHGIDWTAPHTYRLENRIAADGSNMVWLYVDGEEIGPMSRYYIGTADQNTTSDWLSGKDFRFPYMGTDTHGFSNASIDYIQVNECVHRYENGKCAFCGECDVAQQITQLQLPMSYTGTVFVENNPSGFYAGTRNIAQLLGVKSGTFSNGEVTVTVDGTKVTVSGTPTKNLYFDLQTGSFGVPDYKRDVGYCLPEGDYRFGIFGNGTKMPTLCIRNSDGVGNRMVAYHESPIVNVNDVHGSDMGVPYLYFPKDTTYDYSGHLVLTMGCNPIYDSQISDVRLIQGTGELSVNGFLWSADNTTSIYGVVDSLVEKEGRMIYTAGSKPYIRFYLPREEGYLQIRMNLMDSEAINAYGWRLDMMYACDDEYNERFPVTNSGEYEAAIKLEGRPDFMGMGAHGSERMTAFAIFVDGTQMTLEQLKHLTAWEKIRIVRESDFYDPADEKTVVARHMVEYLFDWEGLTVNQQVEWLVDETCYTSYLMMFPVKRSNGELQITDTYFDDFDELEYDAAQPGLTTYPFQWTIGPNKMTLYSSKSGIKATMESLGASVLTGGGYKYCSNSNAYNKLYFTICGGGGSKHTVKEGDVWYASTRYEVTIQKGTDWERLCISGHTYSSEVTVPTCLAGGYTTHTCRYCGDSYVDSITDALGHSYEKGLCIYCGSHLPGDINGDGKVNNKDATRLFQHLSGWAVEVVEAALDVNGDGKVNNKDATRLFQYLSGWQVEIH